MSVCLLLLSFNLVFYKYQMANRLDKSDWGLFFLRLGIGLGFAVVHGFPKLMGGIPKWEKLGASVSLVGITWQPVFWGFMAMFAEFFGGVFLVLGLLVRPAAALMLITMGIAIASNLHSGGSFKDIVEPVEITGGLLCLLIMGSGNISLKAIFKR